MKKIVSVILVLVLALALGATAFADSGVPITKNPTDEARSAGGTAWFVSGAANYNSLEWKFMDPAGTFYTVQEFRNRFPYASVDGEHTTNLTIRNLSTDMNGFGVICTFYNNNGPTDTKMAFLYVSAYAAPTYSAPTYTAPTYTAPRTTTTTTTYYIPYGATDGGYTYDANGNLEYDVYYPDGSYSTFYSTPTARPSRTTSTAHTCTCPMTAASTSSPMTAIISRLARTALTRSIMGMASGKHTMP